MLVIQDIDQDATDERQRRTESDRSGSCSVDLGRHSGGRQRQMLPVFVGD